MTAGRRDVDLAARRPPQPRSSATLLAECDEPRPPRERSRRSRTRGEEAGALEPPALVGALAEAGLLDRLFRRDDDGSGRCSAMELCLIREGLARGCTAAETAFALQGLGSFPLLQSGDPSASTSGSRGWRAARRSPPSPSPSPTPAATSRRSRSRPSRDGERLPSSTARRSGSPTRPTPTSTPSSPAPRRAPAPAGSPAFAVPRDSAGPHRRADRDALRRTRSAGSSSRTSTCPPEHVLGEVDRGFRSRCARSTSSAPASAPSPSAWPQAALAAAVAHAADARRVRRPAEGPPGGLPPARRGRRRASRRRACSSTTPPPPTTAASARSPRSAAMAKLLATEVAQEAVDAAIQIHGARGARARPPARAPVPRRARAADLRGRLGDPARDHRPRAVRPPTEVAHERRDHRRRPRWPLRRDPLRPARRTRSPSGSATPPTTPSASASSSPTRRWPPSRPPTRRATPRSPQLRPLGRHRHLLPRHGRALRRPRLLGARPDAAAEHPPGAGRGARRRRATSAPRRRRVDAADGVARPGDRRRRRQQRRARRATPTHFGPTPRAAPLASSCGWAPTSSSRPSPSTSSRPSAASSRSTATPTTRR